MISSGTSEGVRNPRVLRVARGTNGAHGGVGFCGSLSVEVALTNGNKDLAILAPHSSTLAWKIPWIVEPGRLQSMGSLRVGHD